MSDGPVIQAANISKKFSRCLKSSLWYGVTDILAQFHGGRAAGLREQEFWALRDISFELPRGGSLGIVGNNGAGKSTLLKILMGRLVPTSGHVTTVGKIVAITHLGLGFNPILSGRENVFVNAALMGMPRARTMEVFDDIVNFAGIGDFIDSPVQTYSAGMKARLGYSVAAHLNPDILLVDEVLAVGDVAFKRKCRAHIRRYLDSGGTMILISHDIQAIQTMCNRCMVLDHGRAVFDGDTTEGVHFYYESQRENLDEAPAANGVVKSTAAPTNGQGTNGHAGTENPPSRAPEPIAGGASQDSGPGEPRANPDSSSTPRISMSSVALPPLDPSERPPPRDKPNAADGNPVVIDGITVRPLAGGVLRTGDDVVVTVWYRSVEEIENVVWGFTICTADLATHIASGLYGFEEVPLTVRRGPGVLRGLIRRLPLLPAKYAIKAGMGDASTGGEIAHLGWGANNPDYFVVTSEPSLLNNMHAVIGDLVRLDVDWQ